MGKTRKLLFKSVIFFLAGLLALLVISANELLKDMEVGSKHISEAQISGEISSIGTISSKRIFLEPFGDSPLHWATISVGAKTFNLIISTEDDIDSDSLYLSSIKAPDFMAEEMNIYCSSSGQDRECFYGTEGKAVNPFLNPLNALLALYLAS